MYDFNKQVLPDYNPFMKGGKKRSRRHRTRRHKKTNKSRTRRRFL